MARVLLIEDSPLQRWMLCRQRLMPQRFQLPVDGCAQALAHVTGGNDESAAVDPRGSAHAVDVALVALPLTQDNGFQCGMLLREAGVRPVLLLADVPRETDVWWARSLGLGTADGAWAVLQRPIALQTLGLALSAALEETRHGQPA